jgi:hypothetical protein
MAFEFIGMFDSSHNGHCLFSINLPELDSLQPRGHILGLSHGDPNSRPLDHWHAVWCLLRRPWFHRVWIIQEVAMASEALVLCGEHTRDWEALSTMAQIFRRNCLFSLIGISTVQAIPLVADLRQEIKREKFIKIPFLGLLITTRSFSSTDPRDQVFGISGLAIPRPTEPQEV